MLGHTIDQKGIHTLPLLVLPFHSYLNNTSTIPERKGTIPS